MFARIRECRNHGTPFLCPHDTTEMNTTMEKLTFYIHPETSFAQAQALVLAHLDELSEQGCYESTLPKLLYPQGDFTEADEARPSAGFIAGIWSEAQDKWVNETAIYLVRHPWAPKGKIVGGYGLKMPRNRNRKKD